MKKAAFLLATILAGSVAHAAAPRQGSSHQLMPAPTAQGCIPAPMIFGEENNIRYQMADDLYDVADACEVPGPGSQSGIPIRVAFIDGMKLAYPVLSGSRVALAALMSETPKVLSEDGIIGADGGTIQADHSIKGFSNIWHISAADVPIEVRALPPGTPVAVGPAWSITSSN